VPPAAGVEARRFADRIEPCPCVAGPAVDSLPWCRPTLRAVGYTTLNATTAEDIVRRRSVQLRVREFAAADELVLQIRDSISGDVSETDESSGGACDARDQAQARLAACGRLRRGRHRDDANDYDRASVHSP
jgi:hypothetical protein